VRQGLLGVLLLINYNIVRTEMSGAFERTRAATEPFKVTEYQVAGDCAGRFTVLCEIVHS